MSLILGPRLFWRELLKPDHEGSFFGKDRTSERESEVQVQTARNEIQIGEAPREY